MVTLLDMQRERCRELLRRLYASPVYQRCSRNMDLMYQRWYYVMFSVWPPLA